MMYVVQVLQTVEIFPDLFDEYSSPVIQALQPGSVGKKPDVVYTTLFLFGGSQTQLRPVDTGNNAYLCFLGFHVSVS